MDNTEWSNDGWTQYQRLVLTELTRHSHSLEELKTHINRIEIEVATIKIRATLWGAIGAAVPALAIIAFEFVKR